MILSLLNIQFLKRMNLINVIFDITWKELFNNEILQHWIVNESFDKCLLIRRNILLIPCHFLEFISIDELEDVFVSLPSHEVGHVSRIFSCSFEVDK